MAPRVVYTDAELWVDEQGGQCYAVYAGGRWWTLFPCHEGWRQVQRRRPRDGPPEEGHRVSPQWERIWLRYFGVPIGED